MILTQADKAVRIFYPVISRPVRYCSLFYSLYYLYVIKGNTELKKLYTDIVSALYDAFYYYGIYTVARELRHIHDNFYYDEYISEASPSVTGLTIINFFKNREYIHVETHYKPVKKFCNLIDANLKAFSKPSPFLSAAYSIFSNHGYWYPGYGGEAYAKIAKIIQSRSSTTPVIFIDTCWNIQHNTEIWLNKVTAADEEYALCELFYTPRVMKTLKRVLDANYDGHIDYVIKVASNYIQYLSDYKEEI